MLELILSTLLLLSLPLTDEGGEISDTLNRVLHVSSCKQTLPIEELASPVSLVNLIQMEQRGMYDLKSFSSLVPNLHIPDYGSAMTSTIYIRGFGSRMDNPVLGLYVDDIPVMNKNAYDFDFVDIREAALLRGPQSTLYGRNSMCGVMSLSTLSPEDHRGLRASFEYGNANTVTARLSVYGNKGMGVSLGYKHSDGFHTNYHDGRQVDRKDGLNLRFRAWKRLRKDLEFDNILSAHLLKQGGWPYRQYDEATGELKRIAYNDYSGYRRVHATEGIKFKYMEENFTLHSVTSLQFLADEMKLDQDFTTRSLFNMTQVQKEVALTQELILKPEISWRTSWWNWQTGLFVFGKYNDLAAPVRFKRDGIEDLILANANKGMAAAGLSMDIREDEFDITSDFGIGTFGAALYHESDFKVRNWVFSAGVRLDYEGARMNYDSRASIHYRMSHFSPGEFRPFDCIYQGVDGTGYFQVLPKFSVLHDAGPVQVYANVSRGYKAGGFNVQIFSDILQNEMMSGLMEDLGVELERPFENLGASNTVYKPETNISTEVGLRFSKTLRSHHLAGTLSAYYIGSNNQQITVFPPGQNTGRMMANAGRSRSFGAEAELSYRWKGLSASAAYGYCDARFIRYHDGHQDYAGKHIPYAPEHTFDARVSYTWDMRNDFFRSISASVNVSSAGRIWWNESNTLSQPFHALLGADVRADFKWFDAFIRGENLTASRYRTFYFKSVGNSFFQEGLPLRFTIGISVDL